MGMLCQECYFDSQQAVDAHVPPGISEVTLVGDGSVGVTLVISGGLLIWSASTGNRACQSLGIDYAEGGCFALTGPYGQVTIVDPPAGPSQVAAIKGIVMMADNCAAPTSAK